MDYFTIPKHCAVCGNKELISVPSSNPDLLAWKCAKCEKLQFRQRKNLEDPACRFQKMCEDFKSLKNKVIFFIILSLFAIVDFLISNWRPIYNMGISTAILKYTSFAIIFTVVMAGFSISLAVYLTIKKWID